MHPNRSLKPSFASLALLAGLSVMASSGVWAQTYPSKPVTVIVPFPGGGIVDILTRAVTDKIAANWGVPIIVEPKPGAGALLGTQTVATAAPDGYTFLVASITGSVGPLINPNFRERMVWILSRTAAAFSNSRLRAWAYICFSSLSSSLARSFQRGGNSS